MQIDIQLPDTSYPVHIGPLPKIQLSGKVLIVTNPRVSGLHLSYLLQQIESAEVYVHTVPDGESYKNMATLESILEAGFNHRLNRQSTMIAFGGGVVGDITGFASGIFQRGIPFIQIPTTLLSQVDASVGGKTGINNRFGKNLVGLFHQPQAVYLDPHFLSTLPPREFGAGVAEIIKMAVTFNRSFFEELEQHDLNDPEFLQRAIERSVETKADVVRQDEKEKGLRAALNYGHTYGHVVENLTGYRTYLHGEAVAIGMVMANILAQELGLLTPKESDRIMHLLQRYDLPTAFHIQNPETFYQQFFLDKKSMDSTIKLILPSGIGDVIMKDDIPKEKVLQAMNTYNQKVLQEASLQESHT